ncbi:MAG: AAA family ATPase [Clostridia bacterium]|nr:AAA family ATPase [Clostridia bacterium]
MESKKANFRECFRPSDRTVSCDPGPLMELIRGIEEKQAGTDRLLVTLDGPCASGKTTLANRLAAVLAAAVVHTDHFVIPHAQKTAERLAIPGGNCDAGRLVEEVVAPWKRGEPVKYRKYDWTLDCLLPAETLPSGCRVLIVEGSYCNLPQIRSYADIRLFMQTPEEVRFARLRKRESPASLKRFYERWIPLENAYFEAYGLPDENCLIVQ